MKYWVKILPDGSEIYGTEKDEAAGRVSWSGTPCVLSECILEDGEQTIQIKGNGEYWQSDTYESVVSRGVSKPIKVKRRIMRMVKPKEKLVFVSSKTRDHIALDFNYIQFEPVNVAYTGQWAVAELDLITREMKYYFVEEKF